MNGHDSLRDGVIGVVILTGLWSYFASIPLTPVSNPEQSLKDAFSRKEDQIVLNGTPYILTTQMDGQCTVIEAHRLLRSGTYDTFEQTSAMSAKLCP